MGRGAGALWRRSYDVPPPGGESLKDTVARALPYYCQNILPAVLGGKRVLVAAHGNSLRALVMVLDRLTPKTIPTHGARDRRAAGLSPQRRFDRRLQGRAHGLIPRKGLILTLCEEARLNLTLSDSRVAELSNDGKDFRNCDDGDGGMPPRGAGRRRPAEL